MNGHDSAIRPFGGLKIESAENLGRIFVSAFKCESQRGSVMKTCFFPGVKRQGLFIPAGF